MKPLAAAGALVLLATSASLSFSSVAAVAGSADATRSVAAPPAGGGNSCSAKTLKGKYATTFQGSILTPIGNYGIGPLSVVAVLDSDGVGAFTGTGKANILGVPVTQAGTGTYAVNADCTGTATFHYPAFSIDVFFVITGDGDDREVWFINTSQPAVIHGSIKKL